MFVVIPEVNDTMQQLMFTLMRLRSALSTGPAEESFAVAAPPHPPAHLPSLARFCFLGFSLQMLCYIFVCVILTGLRDACDGDDGRYLHG